MMNCLEAIQERELKGMLNRRMCKFLEDAEREGMDIDDVALALIEKSTDYLDKPFKEERLSRGLWFNICREIYLLVCTDDRKYKDLREKFSSEKTLATAFIVSSISTSIGAALGFVATTVTPFVVLCLIALVRIGKEAWCRSFRQGEDANRC